MSTKISQIRFKEGRNHLFRRPKSCAIGLSSEQIYERKQQQRKERAEKAAKSERIDEYIRWIYEIQRRLGLSNANFAKRLGVTAQTVKLWKRKSGHLPSERTLKRLLVLERESKIPVKITKLRYGMRML